MTRRDSRFPRRACAACRHTISSFCVNRLLWPRRFATSSAFSRSRTARALHPDLGLGLGLGLGTMLLPSRFKTQWNFRIITCIGFCSFSEKRNLKYLCISIVDFTPPFLARAINMFPKMIPIG